MEETVVFQCSFEKVPILSFLFSERTKEDQFSHTRVQSWKLSDYLPWGNSAWRTLNLFKAAENSEISCIWARREVRAYKRRRRLGLQFLAWWSQRKWQTGRLLEREPNPATPSLFHNLSLIRFETETTRGIEHVWTQVMETIQRLSVTVQRKCRNHCQLGCVNKFSWKVKSIFEVHNTLFC